MSDREKIEFWFGEAKRLHTAMEKAASDLRIADCGEGYDLNLSAIARNLDDAIRRRFVEPHSVISSTIHFTSNY